MDILVCIKQVPATSEVEIDEATGVLKRSGAAAKINPYDLFALEQALTLREAHGGSVTVLSMGPQSAADALTEAMEIGADKAVLLSDRRFAGADVLATSRALAAGIRKAGPFGLILCGKQTTDGDTAQVGPEVAEFLGIPHASYVQGMAFAGGLFTVTVNLGGSQLVQTLPTPCLLTVEKDINTPRLPSYRRSLALPCDAIQTYTLDSFDDSDEAHYGLAGSPTQVERIFPPEKNRERQLVQGSAEACAEGFFRLLAENKFI